MLEMEKRTVPFRLKSRRPFTNVLMKDNKRHPMDTLQQTLERASYYRERLASIEANCRDKGLETHKLNLTDIAGIAEVLDALMALRKAPG